MGGSDALIAGAYLAGTNTHRLWRALAALVRGAVSNYDMRHDRFTQADRHVSELKERITRQRAVLVRAQQKGHATEAAESLLRTLEESLCVFEKHRQVIYDRVEAKQRSLPSDGALATRTHPSRQ
jgi:hypothetical protein